MDYLLSLEYLGIKLGLEQVRALVAQLGRPDLAYRSVVVAGTNGKGSVTAMLERGLREAGYRTGRYTSPHLVHLEERFVINGQPIDAESLSSVAAQVRTAAARLPAPPSFFEATTALALEAFRRTGVEIAILEVGLGGRLDATNVVSPMGVGITAVDFDHEQYLGETIEAIAAEKAGVIKPGGVAVLAQNPSTVQRVVRAACEEADAEYVFAPEGVTADAELAEGRTRLRLRTPHADYGELTLALRGRHQIDNAVIAVRLLEALVEREALAMPASTVRAALTDVEWPARLELRRWRDQDVLIDGAHNPAGARALTTYLLETYARRLPMVIGVMRDKKIEQIVSALEPAASGFICTAPDSARAASPGELAAIAGRVAPALDVIEVARPLDALSLALSRGAPAIVAGSLYLAGEIRAEIS